MQSFTNCCLWPLTKRITLALFCFAFIFQGYAQISDNEYSHLLQTYHLQKDKQLVEKSLQYFNATPEHRLEMEPMIIGFYGALFADDAQIKEQFVTIIPQLRDTTLQQLFSFILSQDLDQLIEKIGASTSTNDLNWSAYFATGNVKYLNNIITALVYCTERVDMNLFLSGQSAKWSLRSNAGQDPTVKTYLESIKSNQPKIAELLAMEPSAIHAEMIDILKAQKAKGIWK